MQVQRTSDQVAAAGRHAWRATRWTTKRAMKGPTNLAHMLRGESRENLAEGEDQFSDEESHRPEYTRALLDVRCCPSI